MNFIVGKNNFRNIKSILNNEQKVFIKKYFFPYKFISEQQRALSQLQHLDVKKELKFKKELNDTIILNNSLLSNGMFLEKFFLSGGFNYGIWPNTRASGFLDFYNDDIFVLSSSGNLVHSNSFDKSKILKQIPNNIDEYINLSHFSKSNRNWFSLKDLLIDKDKIFISYTEEIKKNCWNTSIIYGNINYKYIKFKKLFSPKKCIHSSKNIDNEFNAWQSGGKIISFDDENLLFSVGDYRNRFLAQDKKSVNGKILKINVNNGKYKIISMGHRNPQGLYFDKENNFILETEHGPKGGDEINKIDIKKINDEQILNYGWPVVSAGEHYGGKTLNNKKKYEKYPLYKSHTKYGFIEPLKSFVPSIAISEIIKLKNNKYVVASMKDKSLYFFELNTDEKIINLERVEVYERVRDLKLNKNKLYLFLENSGSIGLINLN
tara:strand:- start:515 stop:1816 length:1302 start_codon:yes stop_codon:yes gene_type:complete